VSNPEISDIQFESKESKELKKLNKLEAYNLLFRFLCSKEEEINPCEILEKLFPVLSQEELLKVFELLTSFCLNRLSLLENYAISARGTSIPEQDIKRRKYNFPIGYCMTNMVASNIPNNKNLIFKEFFKQIVNLISFSYTHYSRKENNDGENSTPVLIYSINKKADIDQTKFESPRGCNVYFRKACIGSILSDDEIRYRFHEGNIPSLYFIEISKTITKEWGKLEMLKIDLVRYLIAVKILKDMEAYHLSMQESSQEKSSVLDQPESQTEP